MKFYWDGNDAPLKDILIELTNQYADNFSHLGINYWNEFIKPNIELLEIVIDEIKEDLILEYKFRKDYTK